MQADIDAIAGAVGMIGVTPGGASITRLVTGQQTTFNVRSLSLTVVPKPGRLLFLVVATALGTPPTITVSGLGVTWDLVDAVNSGSTRLAVYRAMSTSMTSGDITISINQDNYITGHVYEVSGATTAGAANGAGAIVQAVHAATTTVTLAALAAGTNLVFGAYAHGLASGGFTPDTGYIESGDSGSGNAPKVGAEYNVGDYDLSLAPTGPNNPQTIIGIEVSIDAGLPDDACLVVAKTTAADNTISVRAGNVYTGGALAAVSAGTLTVTNAHATLDRIDLVKVDASGTKAMVDGTAAATPIAPALTAGDVLLAMVYVPHGGSTLITDSCVTDKRCLVRPEIVDVFSASGTWTKRAWADFIEIVVIGGGGGASSGQAGGGGTNEGGGGGGGAGISLATLHISDVPLLVPVTVGAAGVGGAANTASSATQNDGTDGGASSFGGWVRATGGVKGAGPTGTGGVGGTGTFAGGTGGFGSGESAGNDGATGGGGSGGHGQAAVVPGGQPGGVPLQRAGITPAAGGAVNTAGTAATVPTATSPGGGGGGGGGTATTPPGAGANGVNGGGGGGGGGAGSGALAASGKGGNGGGGLVYVISRVR